MNTPLNETSFQPQTEPQPFFLQLAEPAPIIAPMTVGIAAICAGRKAIVMAADQLMSVGSDTNLSMDTDSKKLMELTPKAWVAVTGTVQDNEYAQERFKHASSLLSLQSVYGVGRDCARRANICAQQIEEKILRPIWNVNFKEFKRASLRSPIAPIVNDVNARIINFQYQLTLLVCGFDGDGAHIYRVTHSFVNSHKGLGFHAIGYGETIATMVLASRGKNFAAESIEETAYRVYEAKRTSERLDLSVKAPTWCCYEMAAKRSSFPKS